MMEMGRNLCAVILVTMLVVSSAFADIDGEEQRPFELLLDIAPVVVIAQMADNIGTSVKTFKENVEEPFVEVYTHYLFSVDTVLKGRGMLREQTFEVRVIGGEAEGAQSKPVLTFDPKQLVLLVLTPDVGSGPDGRPRTGFLVSYQAKYPVVGGQVEVPTASGMQRWSIERVKEEIARIQAEKERRRKLSDEPDEARKVEMFAGEESLGGSQELPPPFSQVLRDPGRTSDERLKKVIPLDSKPPNEVSVEPPAGAAVVVELVQGINLMSMPLAPPEPWRLSNLAAFIGNELSFIVWHDKKSGRFISYSPEFPESSPANKVVEPGDGYVVFMRASKTVTFVGQAWSNTVITAAPAL